MNKSIWRWQHMRFLVMLFLLSATLYVVFVPYHTAINLPIQALEPASIRGLYETEISSERGQLFRWTDGRAQLRVPRQGLGTHQITLHLAAPLTQIYTSTLQLNGNYLATLKLSPQLRAYQILAPQAFLRWGDNRITISSNKVQVPGDTRLLGIIIGNSRWAALEDSWPLLPLLQTLCLLLACGALYAVLFQLHEGQRLGIVTLFLAISLMMQHSDLRVERRFAAMLLSIGLALLFLIGYGLLRWKSRSLPTEQTWRAHPVRWRSADLLPLGIFFGLTLLTFAGILPNFAGQVYGPAGDNFEYIWKIAWVEESLLSRRGSVLFQPDFFFPAGFDLARSELTPAHTLPGAVISLLIGPVAAYNSLLMVNTMLTCFFTMLLAQQLGASKLGSIVAAIGVGFCSYRFFYSLGTLPMAGSQWVVLSLYGWERFLTQQRRVDAVIAGLGLALAAWSSWYYGVTLPFLLVLYTMLRLPLRQWLGFRCSYDTLLPGIIVAVALLAPYAQPYLTLTPAPHGRSEVLRFSAMPLDYLIPNPFQMFWGPFLLPMVSTLGLHERVSIGWGLLVLALLAFWQTRQQRRTWALIGVASFWMLLSLGPELHVNNVRIVLPGEFIYQYVPGLKNIRVWSRMAFYVQLMIALLASMALTNMARQSGWKRAACIVLIGMVVLESLSASPWQTASAARPVEQWLAQQPRRAVLHVPDTLSGWHEFQTLTTDKPLTAGYGTFFPPSFLPEYFALQTFPSASAVRAIHHLQPGYLVINHAILDTIAPAWQEVMKKQPEFQQIYRDQTVTVYLFNKEVVMSTLGDP